MTRKKGGCGTPAGYQVHRRANEDACPACLKAYAKYMRAYRHRTGRNTRTLTNDTTLRAHGIDVTK